MRSTDYDPPRANENFTNVLKLCDDRPRDLVPTDTGALVINVDTQMNGFYYEVAAIGYLLSATTSITEKCASTSITNVL